MFHIPDYYHNFSLRLSEVLGDIGVNEGMVKMLRRSSHVLETLCSLSSGHSTFVFGSKSEGTTTMGLNSDIDGLDALPGYNVMQDYAEWKPGLTNLLMIQNEVTSPGYCHLQLIRHDMPTPVTDVVDEHCVRSENGRLFWKNTVFDGIYTLNTSWLKNGPARTYEGQPGMSPTDYVFALSCESWPAEARNWSQRNLGNWPTDEMKRYVENSGCFVVPVGSKISQMEQLEWRISTSKAERCLMYNLNITQLRCFVLLKMILKTYIHKPVSSYMCKTVLLRSIEKTHCSMWQENNLLKCLTVCLEKLYSSILHKSCPHFFIPGNNLMARQFSPRIKNLLLKRLHRILKGQGAALYGIHIDDLGARLQIKMNPLYQHVQSPHILIANDRKLAISATDIITIAKNVSIIPYLKSKVYQIGSPTTVYKNLVQEMLTFLRLYKNGTNIEKKTIQLLVPLYCSCLGSVLASINLEANHFVSPEAFNWLSAGLNSDVSSGRLKLASVLYCAGDMLRAEIILKETERLYRLGFIEPVCRCYDLPITTLKRDFCRICYTKKEKAINRVCAFCVQFFRTEINCIPHELQYELFRSTQDERLHRDGCDSWMDMAVVDSLPFLYFLQYKTYGNLQRYNDQRRALEHLAFTIYSDEDLAHRETALNLLGECFEQENRQNDAFACYMSSLNVRRRNNVARFHLCRLLADIQASLQKSNKSIGN